ncbi:LytR family transcriptional regulator [Microbacterium sp. MEC084]|uniref:LCP family protein n=1 Tax=Microbacterium sp. MEC084 TaxID=1963027 RepID=UPI00106F13E5|nr:LCP family protein [Microbacterium sp. MEC084]MCD1267768.1 LytR family transcriptional regulator [Microbacterium sp. MEC084]
MSETSPRRPGRRTIARHGHLSQPSLLSRVMRWLGIAMACVLVAGVGVAAYAAWDFSATFAADAQELEGQDTSPPDIGQLVNDEGVDLLLTGIDICEWDSHEKFGDRCPTERSAYGDDGRQLEAGLNDVNLLVHISPEPRKVSVVAFPRDLMGPMPECTNSETGEVTPASDRRMLNEAYAAGGLACVAKSIDSITTQYDPELAIDYAATVTWNGVIEITNALGGVEVCVDQTINDVDAGMLYLEPGTHTLVGEQALAFLRSRHGVGGGDLARISNQQVYMSSLARKLMSAETLTNPGTLLSLARTTVSNVDPSAQLTPITLVQIAMAASSVPLSDIEFLQYPVLEDPLDRNRVISDDTAAAQLFGLIAANQSVIPDEQVAASPEPTEPEAPVESETPTPEVSEPPVATAAPAPGRTAEDTSCSNPIG